MYHVLDLTSLRTRARYDRGLQYSTPVALVVVDAAGAAHRAEYVDSSLLALGRAVYRVAGAEFELRPSGQLVPVDVAELPAIEPLEEQAELEELEVAE